MFLLPSFAEPYLDLLEHGLVQVMDRHDATLERASRPTIGIAARSGRGDAVHLQWIEYIYRVERPGPIGAVLSLGKAVALLGFFALLRLRRARVVITIHNLRPHDSPIPGVDRLVDRGVATLANVRVVHSESSRRALEHAVPGRAATVVMPFGAFERQYPAATEDRESVRARLGIPATSRVALAFGQARPYKHLETLIESFRALDDDDIFLLIAGKALNAAYANELRDLAAGDDRIRLELTYIDDADVAALYQAVDLAVIPYPEVFSSGALILALSMGVPAVAPAKGAATELASRPVITTFEEGRFGDALAEALDSVARESRMTERAREAVPDKDWSAAGEILARRAYRLKPVENE